MFVLIIIFLISIVSFYQINLKCIIHNMYINNQKYIVYKILTAIVLIAFLKDNFHYILNNTYSY